MKVGQAKDYNPMDAESIARADINRTPRGAAFCAQTAQLVTCKLAPLLSSSEAPTQARVSGIPIVLADVIVTSDLRTDSIKENSYVSSAQDNGRETERHLC